MPSNTFLAVAATGAAALGASLWYLGCFRKVRFVEATLCPMTMIAYEGKGPFYNVGEVFQKLEAFAKAKGLKVVKTIGLYFSDPKTVKESDLEWTCGIVVSDSDISRLDEAELKKNKFIVKHLKEYTKCAKTTFPIVLRPLSFMVSAMRVYPAFDRQTEFKGLQSGAIEVYDFSDWTIYIYFPQENYAAYLPDKDHGNKF